MHYSLTVPPEVEEVEIGLLYINITTSFKCFYIFAKVKTIQRIDILTATIRMKYV